MIEAEVFSADMTVENCVLLIIKLEQL